MIEQVGVVGAGTMGIGVSHMFATGGCEVTLVDVSEAVLDRARSHILRDLRMAAMFAPGGPRPAETLDRIRFSTELKDLAGAGFVVENVTENPDVKEPVYREMDGVCADECVFGVNTSAIPITRVASFTGRPDRVIGAHFMNPAHLKPMVELIRGFHTSDGTIRVTQDLLGAMGKDSIVVQDSPGFVTNRVAMLTVNEAICLLDEGVSTAAEIDRLFVTCFGHKMGPLATADLIGLDTILYSLDMLLEHFNDPSTAPRSCCAAMSTPACSAARADAGSSRTTPTPPQSEQ